MKKPNKQREGNKSSNTNVDSKGKRKVKYPYLIYGGDHLTKECPRHEEVNKFMKNPSTLVILNNPLPTQQQFIGHLSLHGSSSYSINEFKMMSSESVHITTIS